MLACVLAGCGGAAAVGPHERHATIQVREADLERALVRAADPELVDCAEREALLDDAVVAARAICELASAPRDADAMLRCERARRRSEDARDGLRAACGA